MQHCTFKELQKELGNSIFRTCLKYDRICLIRRNNQQAWLLPLTDLPPSVLQYLPIADFRQSIGFYVDRLREYCERHGVFTTIALTDVGSEHICYLSIEPPKK